MRLSRVLCVLSGKYAEKFMRYGAFTPTPLSLKQLTSFGEVGSKKKSAIFLSTELPVRLANIMQEIQLLPERLIQTPSSSLVNQWYEQSFCELLEFEEVDWDDKLMDSFTSRLAKIRERHTTTVETMAQGVMEMQSQPSDIVTNSQVQYFLDRFFMMRISIRMLINQHLTLFGHDLNERRRFVGCIDPACDVLEILNDAFDDAKYLCQHHYASSPDMEVQLCGDTNGKVEFVYVPSHLHHILFELLKNAVRAVMETHKNEDTVPPIKVLIASGQENVTVKISDRGGGIPRSSMGLVFNYTYTTVSTGNLLDVNNRSHEDSNAPLAGYGYGLPLSRLYAKYFNGDLQLISVEGYGTDAVLYLKTHAADADELLPVFNRTTAKQYGVASIPIGDWSNPDYRVGLGVNFPPRSFK